MRAVYERFINEALETKVVKKRFGKRYNNSLINKDLQKENEVMVSVTIPRYLDNILVDMVLLRLISTRSEGLRKAIREWIDREYKFLEKVKYFEQD